MHYIFFLMVMMFATSASAAQYTLDFEELFPNQIYFKSLTLSGDFHMTKTNNPPEEGNEIFLVGPCADMIIETKEGDKWKFSLDSFHLHLFDQQADFNKKFSIDLRSSPTKNFQSTKKTLITSLLKALIVGKGSFQLKLESTSDIKFDTTYSEIFLQKGKQNLHMTIDNNLETSKTSWQMASHLFGVGTLIDLFISAFDEINENMQHNAPQDKTEALLQQTFQQIAIFKDFAEPLLAWDGVVATISGELEKVETEDLFSLSMRNDFKLVDDVLNWSARLGIRSYYALENGASYHWKQEFILSDIANDLERLCKWTQINATDKLAGYFNSPSISYYGNYFPLYFTAALKALLMKVSEPQGDGTLLITLSGGEFQSPKMGLLNLYELSSEIVAYVKSKLNYFW